MRSVVSERGQVVIPKALRDRLGIRPGQELDFVVERGRLIARKISAQDAVAKVSGILKLKRPVDDVMKELRGEPDDR